jgi:hypothetical protein
MSVARVLVAFITASLVVSLASAMAQTSSPVIDQVQEDWQLVVTTPDVPAVGPQITTCMSPVSDNSTPFVAYDLNYREYPQFAAGGMQLQVWSGEDVLSTDSYGSNQFSTPNETVTWTQSMAIGSGGKINYNIYRGISTTWGYFCWGGNPLTVSYSTSLRDLNSYSPETSVANSGVSWQSNYVTSLTLVQVRYYSGGTLVATDTTPRTIPLTTATDPSSP